jgi:hypothetical protein
MCERFDNECSAPAIDEGFWRFVDGLERVFELVENAQRLEGTALELVKTGPGDWVQSSVVPDVCPSIDSERVSDASREIVINRGHVACDVNDGLGYRV